MANCGLDPSQDEDIRHLQSMFSELDIETITRYYLQCDRDVSETMKALGVLLKNPPAALAPHGQVLVQPGPESCLEGLIQ